MLSLILRRLLYAAPIAFGVSLVCFSLVYLAPGDPLQAVMPADITPDMVEMIKHEYGFDKHRVGKSTNGSRRCLPASEMVTKGFSKNLKGFWITEAHTSARIASARQGHSPSGAAQS